MHWVICVVHRIVNEHLVRAFPRFSLHAIHEAPSEDDDLVAEDAAAVTVPAGDAVDGAVVNVLPVRPVRSGHEPGDFIVTFVVLSTY